MAPFNVGPSLHRLIALSRPMLPICYRPPTSLPCSARPIASCSQATACGRSRLTTGTGLFSHLVVSAWAGLHRLSPTLVGGCRPLELQALLEVRSFQVEYVRTVVAFGIPSEVVIAQRQPQARTTAEEGAVL